MRKADCTGDPVGAASIRAKAKLPIKPRRPLNRKSNVNQPQRAKRFVTQHVKAQCPELMFRCEDSQVEVAHTLQQNQPADEKASYRVHLRD